MKWFWADLHFDHDAIVTKMLRKADSPESWYETAINAMNMFVSRNDSLYLLGDFSFKRPGFWRSQIDCKNVHLIKGNHEPGAEKLRNVFGGQVYDIKEVKVCETRTILCHYPMAYWNRSHRGSYHLYGHIHHHLGRERVMDMSGDRKSMDVSPEASLDYLGLQRPFNEIDIHNLLSGRKGHDQPMMENE
jgi:calcineurin-like phosphoesterase family protein